MSKHNNLIIGSFFPIGGVTIHVQRLLFHLDRNGIKYDHLDLRRDSYWQVFIAILKNKRIHLHSSNVYLRFILSLSGKLLFKKVFLTLHGDFGRYNSSLKNLLDLLALKYAYQPILLNNKSLDQVLKFNKKAVLGTSFLPPNKDKEFLKKNIKKEVKNLRKNHKIVFCTNASNLSYDKDGFEIYGIFELIEIFKKNPNIGLIISDPSGNYNKEMKKKKIILTPNILLISGSHSFYSILDIADGCIRNTSTDGDSVSVKEALYLGKKILCTNVVSRPNGAEIYKKGHINEALKKNLKDFKNLKTDTSLKKEFDKSIDQIIDLYK